MFSALIRSRLSFTLLADRDAGVPLDGLPSAVFPSRAAAAKAATRLTPPGRLVSLRDYERDVAEHRLGTSDRSVPPLYVPFFQDFGPFSLAATTRLVRWLDGILTADAESSGRDHHKQVVWAFDVCHGEETTNTFVFLALYLVYRFDVSAANAVGFLRPVLPFLLPFHDASEEEDTFALTAQDVVAAAARCRSDGRCSEPHGHWGFPDLDAIDVEWWEAVEAAAMETGRGDANWIDPGRFLAMSAPRLPAAATQDEAGAPSTAPAGSSGLEHEADAAAQRQPQFLASLGVDAVVQLNEEASYDVAACAAAGIAHYAVCFPDGAAPTRVAVLAFLQLARRHACLAVHCKAGLGRTGTLLAAALVAERGLTVREAIAWCRLCRPGCVIGPQQHFLVSLFAEKEQPSASPATHRAAPSTSVDVVVDDFVDATECDDGAVADTAVGGLDSPRRSHEPRPTQVTPPPQPPSRVLLAHAARPRVTPPVPVLSVQTNGPRWSPTEHGRWVSRAAQAGRARGGVRTPTLPSDLVGSRGFDAPQRSMRDDLADTRLLQREEEARLHRIASPRSVRMRSLASDTNEEKERWAPQLPQRSLRSSSAAVAVSGVERRLLSSSPPPPPAPRTYRVGGPNAGTRDGSRGRPRSPFLSRPSRVHIVAGRGGAAAVAGRAASSGGLGSVGGASRVATSPRSPTGLPRTRPRALLSPPLGDEPFGPLNGNALTAGGVEEDSFYFVVTPGAGGNAAPRERPSLSPIPGGPSRLPPPRTRGLASSAGPTPRTRADFGASPTFVVVSSPSPQPARTLVLSPPQAAASPPPASQRQRRWWEEDKDAAIVLSPM